MSSAKALKLLEKRRNAVVDATADLEDFLLALHDSDHWETITYAQLAYAMHVSRQAVQQRVLLLLERGARRKSADGTVDPNQLTLPGYEGRSGRPSPS